MVRLLVLVASAFQSVVGTPEMVVRVLEVVAVEKGELVGVGSV